MKNCKICKSESKLLYKDIKDDRYGYPGNFSIYQCQNCNFGQIDSWLSEKKYDELYTKYYPRKKINPENVKKTAKVKVNKIRKTIWWLLGKNNQCHFKIKPQKKVLDIGCGDGRSLLEIAAQGSEAYGSEKDANVKKIAEKLNLKIHFGDIDTLPHPDEFFNFITMNQLIEHVPNPINFLYEVSKKLKPGGKIILSTPNIESYNCQRSKRKWINWHVPYHQNFFSKESLNILAENTKLKLIKVVTITPTIWTILQNLSNEKNNIGFYVRSEKETILLFLRRIGIKKSVKIIKAHLFAYFSIPFRRIIDKQKKGDSFLVILQK
ncbi:MAG: class I SAM-dependent methyltransferase [Patescibacteria group bacterium]